MSNESRSRRRVLAATGAAGLAGLAGCTERLASELGRPGTDDDASNESNASNETDSVDESVESRTDEVPPLETEYHSREEFRQPGESFDDFEDLDAWTVVEGSGEADEDVVFDGSQSFRLFDDGDGTIVAERDLGDEDLTDRDVSMAVRTTTPGNVAVYLRFVDGYGSYRIHQLRAITYRTPDVGWFRSSPGVFEESSVPPEMGDLERLELVVLNTGPDAEVWIDDLRLHEKPDTGYVVLGWDDGRSDYYDVAAPMHDEFDFRAVQSVIPGYSGDRYMSVDQLRERQEQGDEIVVHGTHDPMAKVDEDDLDARLGRDKQWFIDNGFRGADFIVYPHNSFDATSLERVGDYHYCGGHNQSGDVNTTGVYGFDPLVLPRTIGHDLDIATRCVDLAAAHRNCTILNFHAFGQENTMSEDDYRALLEHIDESEVEVVTYDDLWRRRREGH